MCGVAGILCGPGAAPPTPQTLMAMLGVLQHRGPDGWGALVGDRLALGHVRLSLLDLEGGAQPLSTADGTYWISFNGEVYNHDDLRSQLRGLGHSFVTRSDTEVMVRAFEEWGDSAWTRFNGQFAAAIWNARTRALTLARDRVGICPLFYAILRHGGHESLVFASEIKALIAAGFTAELDPAGLWRTMALWSVPAPDTVWKGIHSVEPGQVLTINSRLEVSSQRYWQPGFRPRAEPGDNDHELESRLTGAVRLRLKADVPVGAYLSGGVDSSVIATLARREVGPSLSTFSLRFEQSHFDETEHQRAMAAALGTTHHEVMCNADLIARGLEDTVWHCEVPLTRLGPVPMYILSGLVRAHGIKAVLTGEGADEVLCGYDIFRESSVRRFWSRNPNSIMRGALMSRVHAHVARGEGSAMWAAFFARGLDRPDEPFFAHRVRWENAAWGARLLNEPTRRATSLAHIMEELGARMPAGWETWGPLERAQGVEIVSFLSSYLLSSQADRVSMAHGIEGRYPFLDADVMDFCAALPRRAKLSGLNDKVSLRSLASRLLPEQIWKRPKHPYRAPISQTLFGTAAPGAVRDRLSSRSVEQHGLADKKAVELLSARAWSGKPLSEREEMALVCVLTAHILLEQFGKSFRSRVQDALRRLQERKADVWWSGTREDGRRDYVSK